MNENVLGFIKWAAGIVITLAIISIAFLVFNMAKEGTMNGANKIQDMNAQIADSDMTIYDDEETSGSEVVNVIRKFKGDYLGIQVKTGKNTGGTWYGYNVTLSSDVGTIGAAATSSVTNAIDETNNQYVNPNGKFMGKVYRDSNGAVVAIVFTQK
ncbi:MAG: hypothetical protein H7X94_03710 [Vallitaleaceae bacterium]|nr:hypothetical protein [Vallitaleaceae bacterium]